MLLSEFFMLVVLRVKKPSCSQEGFIFSGRYTSVFKIFLSLFRNVRDLSTFYTVVWYFQVQGKERRT